MIPSKVTINNPMPPSFKWGLSIGGVVSVISAVAIGIIIAQNGSFNGAFAYQKIVMLSLMSTGGSSFVLFCITSAAQYRNKEVVSKDFFEDRLNTMLEREVNLKEAQFFPDVITRIFFQYVGLKALFLAKTVNLDDKTILKSRVDAVDPLSSLEKIKESLIKLSMISSRVKLEVTNSIVDPLEKIFAWETLSLEDKYKVLGELYRIGLRDVDALSFVINYLLRGEVLSDKEPQPSGNFERYHPNINELLLYCLEKEIHSLVFIIYKLPHGNLKDLPPELLKVVAEKSYEGVFEVCLARGIGCADSDFLPILAIASYYGWAKVLSVMFSRWREKLLLRINSPIDLNFSSSRVLDWAIQGALCKKRILTNGQRFEPIQNHVNFKNGNYAETIKLLIDHNVDPTLLDGDSKSYLQSGEINYIAQLLPPL